MMTVQRRFPKPIGLFPSVQAFSVLILFLILHEPLFSQLPTASEIAAQMTIGWNIGNSLEVPTGETGWGNPRVDQELIDAVSDAGFNTIRIPCAWDSHADQTTLEIDPDWLDRVAEVVDYCNANGLYIILNCHWDGGWLENNVTTSAQNRVNQKQQSYWTQIAEHFKDYDGHLLFAGANEPNVENATQMTVLMSYHQTFIDAVRAMGGNNSSRVLVVQGPSTDIDKTNRLMTSMPADQIENRLMIEIHYYTPWNFCGMDKDETWGKMAYFWGKNFHSTTNPSRNATWGEEDIVGSYFQIMKTKFVDKGIPVIMGEYSALKRTSLAGADLDLHIASREYFFRYVTESAKRHGLMPIVWDNGYSGNNGIALFNRNNGTIVDPGALDALIQGASAGNSVEEQRKSDTHSIFEYIHALSTPGSSSSEIRFSLNEAARVNIVVFNVLGQAVARLNDLNFGSGPQKVCFQTGGWSPGTYIIDVNTDGHRLTKKLIMMH